MIHLTAQSRSARNRILIVDDDPSIREVFQDMLHLARFDTAVAADGRTALSMLQQDPTIGLVLLDLNMPDMNGWEFLLEQRGGGAEGPIPAIVITGSVVVPPERIPVAAYLRKPMPQTQLIAAVSAHCTPVG
jgi:CheY-like chemotaxis protein